MNVTILLPHYKTGKMTAYAVTQFLKCQGRHGMNIVIIDNGQGEGLDLIPKDPCISIITYPPGLLQSHGIAFDYVLTNYPDLIQEHFITVESDSFPVREDWLDAYERAALDGYDMMGGRMKLSGGTYIHPAGTMYKKSNWVEAKAFLDSFGYFYCEVGPEKKFYYLFSNDLSKLNASSGERLEPLAKCVFHTGIGFNNEDIKTYGYRTIESEQNHIVPPATPEHFTFERVGFEPGQWFCYWHFATGKKILEVATQTVWLPNRVNQQQEYSLTEHGFKHLWGVSAYNDCTAPELKDIIDFKHKQVEELYATL